MTQAESKPKAESAKPAKRPRGEGQWALGYREPLNANEQAKKDDNPLNVRARIENIYAKGGFESIDKGDLRGRFRWWGLYTQRKPGYDGTWTGDDNTDMLEDEYFMLRVRCDGGALTAAALRTLGGISTEFARDTADISDRAERPVPLDPGREHAGDLEAASTRSGCRPPRRAATARASCSARRWPASRSTRSSTAPPRSTRSSSATSASRSTPTCRASSRPRSRACRTSCTRSTTWRSSASNHPEHGPGFDLWVGGGLSTNPMLGQRVGAWVPLDEVPDVWEGVVSVFRDYGYRRLRAKARLKFLIKDWGVEKFREVLETEYLKRPLIDGPAPEPVPRPIDHVGVQRLKNGLNAVGVAPIAGRVSGTILTKVADLAEAAGSDRIRFTPYQKLIILDVPDDKLDALRAGLDALGLPVAAVALAAKPDGLHGHRVLQAVVRRDPQAVARRWCPSWRSGSRTSTPSSTCRSPSTSTAARTRARASRSPTSASRARWSTTATAPVEGFQVHLGGSLGLDSGFGRKLRQHKVTVRRARRLHRAGGSQLRETTRGR